MTRNKVHINCDMGESFGRYTLVDDEALMEYIDSCNIACGYHAGDPIVIDNTISLAIKNEVAIGAHPSYPDRQGFGRRTMDISERDLEAIIRYQVAALQGMVTAQKGTLLHVKAHGALYNKASTHAPSARAIAKAVSSISKELILYAPYQSVLSDTAQDIGLKVFHEAFIDRHYNPDRSLVSRKLEGAVISDPIIAYEQVKSIKTNEVAIAQNGELFEIKADTFCIHGDNPAAINILKYIQGAQS